ncbi:hypothetical protein [Hyalangium rubrum]|uniref:Uncharacterized protein n=1 Tax=Hyalangium rubrum TaxID=3103134 RepID=A0ABU5HGL2_9BACT|nr:hypothetical protein [Hyalangium sp. s54d21]MDY7232284.1 hypothetical protein [Hyalangium sp. s54d21]
MALPPVSRPSVPALSSDRVSQAETRGLRSLDSSQFGGTRRGQGLDMRRMLQSDGFDSPMMDPKQVNNLKEVAQVFARLAQVLSQTARLLGGEGGPGLQGTPAVKGAQTPPSAPGAKNAPSVPGEQPAPAMQGTPGEQPTPAAQPAPAEPGAPVSQAQAIGSPGDAKKEGNTMTFTNDGTKPMTIQFTPNAGEKPMDPLTIEPGKTQTVAFPQGWSGNFRSTSGDGAAATLGEVKFNGGGNQTYYDVSYIEGLNASMTIEPEGGGRKSGTLDNLLASAPDAIKAKDANGQTYGIKKTTTSNVQDPGIVDYYRKLVGADQGYVIPTDDASTLGTGSTHLNVRLKNLAV